MFILKKIIGGVIMPVPFCFLLFFTGMILLAFSRRKRLGTGIMIFGWLLLGAFSFPWLPDFLVNSLESQNPPLASFEEVKRPEAGGNIWIIVLGSGSHEDPGRPASLKLNQQALGRLTEGVRLAKMIPGSRLVVSGGTIYGEEPCADVMKAAAVSLGIEENRITANDKALDTVDEMTAAKKLAGADPVILITSATHMPRALAIFQKGGMTPIPAPADFVGTAIKRMRPEGYLPGSYNLYKSRLAIHEYIGILWGKVRGHL